VTNMIEDVYNPMLQENGFTPKPEDQRFGAMGLCWELAETVGQGYYWIYHQKDLFDIKIHNFCFHEDAVFEFRLPKCLSITYYESFSGEELNPYRRLSADCVKTFIGGEAPCHMLIHKAVPIQSVGIEMLPAYYEDYLRRQYPGDDLSPRQAYKTVDQTEHFPEMVRLLKQVKHYRGEGIAAKLFYESKVAEAFSLVMARYKQCPPVLKPRLTESDRRQIEAVTAYIDDHYADELPLERLSKIACMGTTKLKASFRGIHGCTITEYIQQRRMHRAEHLLSSAELSVGQVAQAVGYRSASHFAELFRSKTGLTPLEYRILTDGSN